MTLSIEKIPNPKLFSSIEHAIARRDELKAQGKKLVLSNGCFDLIHPGHLYYLQEASKLGDELWIALNSSGSVQALKGPTRPVQSDIERAYCLAALTCVSRILIFEGERLDKEICSLKPDIYVKAGDYTLETLDLAEKSALDSIHASICFVPFLAGYSTTSLIKKITEARKTF